MGRSSSREVGKPRLILTWPGLSVPGHSFIESMSYNISYVAFMTKRDRGTHKVVPLSLLSNHI